MGFQKYAAAEVLSAELAGSTQSVVRRTAHRHAFSYTPREGFLYVRSRAISSRTNDNYDEFPAEEIKKAYRTFVGRPVFVNHHNDDHRRARGVIIDAALHEDVNPDGSPDTWTEVLMEVDAKRFPLLAKAILAGEIDRTSMGTDVSHSVCTACGNVAKTPLDYCAHIPRMKGQRIYRTTASGEKVGVLVAERCYGLNFFENSLLVEDPADPTAFAWVESGDVAPRTAGLYRPDGGTAYSETDPDLGQGQLTSTGESLAGRRQGEQIPLDDAHVGLGQSALGVGHPGQTAASLDHVPRVLPVGAKPPVGWVVADRVVAGMPDDLTDRNRADQGRVSPPMRPDAGPFRIAQGQTSVAAGEGSTGPRPAGLGSGTGVDVAPVPRKNAHPRQRTAADDGPSVAGVAVKAADTGRVLMLQRSFADESDPARGTWEFPGGHAEDGEGLFDGAVREWQEETGLSFPSGDPGGVWDSGDVYRGFLWIVPSEDVLPIHDTNEREHINPDDPDGDDTESVAWWEPEQLPKNPAVRDEVRSGTDWDLLGVTRPKTARQVAASIAQIGQENDHVRSFEGRPVPEQGDRVAVYRDLSGAPKSGYPARGSWSIKRLGPGGGRSGHVYAHTIGLHIKDAQPIFDEAAREKFKTEEKRGVHAYIGGTVHEYRPPREPEGDGWREISYYPDISHFFTKDDRRKYHGSDEFIFSGGKAFARGNIKSGEPVGMSKFERTAKDEHRGDTWRSFGRPNLLTPGAGDAGATDNGFDAYSDGYEDGFNDVAKPMSQKYADPASADAFWEGYLDGQARRKQTAAGLSTEAKPRYEPGGHPWYQANPVNPQNIIDHFNRATDEDKEQGRRWYSDANLVATAIAGGDSHKGAGVLAAYSPQAFWPTNMFNAARALQEGVARGGKGSGVFATESMRKQAQAIIDGGRHPEVLKGPKIQDFAHLIEHGGQHPLDPATHVVIDRHALAVAAGKRLTDEQADKAPLDNRHYYNHVAEQYRQAAEHISNATGQVWLPHQVQATTWLVRQRENAMEDAERGERLDRGREKSRNKAQDAWKSFAGEHYPTLAGPGYHAAGLQAQAIGEQTAPAEVDTLRDEECPVCGEDDSFNGAECIVCGYVAPPKQFRDPDPSVAQNNDLRQDKEDAAAGSGLGPTPPGGKPTIIVQTKGGTATPTAPNTNTPQNTRPVTSGRRPTIRITTTRQKENEYA